MQQSGSIFLGIFLSLLVFYGGSGVNAYFYCCGDCRVEGVSAIAERKCCEIHQHHHNGCPILPDGHYGAYTVSTERDHKDCSVSTEGDHKGCPLSFDGSRFLGESHGECGVDRIAFDWQSSQGNQVQLQPTVIDLDNTLFSSAGRTMTIVEDFSSMPCRNRQTQKPPDLSKDDYFALLTTLII